MEGHTSIQPHAVRNGLILGVVSAVFSLILYITDLASNQLVGSFSWIISLGLMIFFMLQTFKGFKAENEGYMTLGEGFKGGFIMSLISSIISGVMNYIYLSFVDTEFFDRMIDMQRETMLQNPDLTEEQVEQALSFAKMLANPEVSLGVGLFMGVIFGAIVALIMAAIAKKEYETY